MVAAQPADDFHFPTGDRRQDVAPPSTRAVKILDLVGVDWRSDTDPDWGVKSLADDGTRPVLPPGWPAVDAELVSALGDLRRLDAAIEAVLPDAYDDPDDVPGYTALDEARNDALATLKRERAQGLPGLQAKARTILTTTVREDDGATQDLAQSLARNLLGVLQSAIEPKPDPILQALAELDRLEAARRAAWEADDSDDGTPARSAVETAVIEHWRAVVLKTVPTTARGCADLARTAVAFHQRWGTSLDRDDPNVLASIARSPLL